MQILPSGQVQITNSETGETRVVDPGQLASFSPLLANQYYNAMAESRAAAKAAGSTPSTDVLQAPNGTMPTMATGQQAPDLSGLSQFGSLAQPTTQPSVRTSTPQAPMLTDSSSARLAPYQPPAPTPPPVALTPEQLQEINQTTPIKPRVKLTL